MTRDEAKAVLTEMRNGAWEKTPKRGASPADRASIDASNTNMMRVWMAAVETLLLNDDGTRAALASVFKDDDA